MTRKEQELQEIAKLLMGLETLKTSEDEEKNFPTISIWKIRNALEAAYAAGMQRGMKEE
jgi:hypothetical protein